MKKELVTEVIDYSCVIRTWKLKGYFGEIIYFQSIHPRTQLKARYNQ